MKVELNKRGTGQICTKGHFCTTVKTNKRVIKINNKKGKKISYRPRVRVRGISESKKLKEIKISKKKSKSKY